MTLDAGVDPRYVSPRNRSLGGFFAAVVLARPRRARADSEAINVREGGHLVRPSVPYLGRAATILPHEVGNQRPID
jgi:hypothetical protein